MIAHPFNGLCGGIVGGCGFGGLGTGGSGGVGEILKTLIEEVISFHHKGTKLAWSELNL